MDGECFNMWIRIMTFAFSCMVISGTNNSLLMGALDHRVVMDQRGSYVMLWSPLKDKIVFEVQVATRGYVGLGFSINGNMKGSDIVIGWIDEAGNTHFSDRHATGNKTPVKDSSQDYQLLKATKNSTHTTFRFYRPWITCDTEHDLPLSDETVRIIWAYDSVIPDPTKDVLNLHDHRGSRSLYLKNPKMIKIPHEALYWDVWAPNVHIPGTLDTLYWCKLFKIPNLEKKNHIIGYIPIIEEHNLAFVHHILLYECTISDSEHHYEKWLALKGAQCYGGNMPVSWNACSTPIVAWASGSEGEFYPDHVGIPIGERHGGATYFLMEIHYDNSYLKDNIVDNSGIRLFITDELRQYDAGVLSLGHEVGPEMIIPPGRTWLTKAHCTSKCTRQTIPPDGVTVISGVLHSHLLGRKIKVQQIRNGRELPVLIEDNNYDFNYQQSRQLMKERLVLPGDHLITTCNYDSTLRKNATFGGFGTEEEMCLVFLFYYPRYELSNCLSGPDFSLLLDTFGVKNLFENDIIMPILSQGYFSESYINTEKENEDLLNMQTSRKSGENGVQLKLVDFFRYVNISEPTELRGHSFYDVVTNENVWKDEALILRLKQAVSSLQYEPRCLGSGGKLIHSVPTKEKSPRYIPLRSMQENCTHSEESDTYNVMIPQQKTSLKSNERSRIDGQSGGVQTLLLRHEKNCAHKILFINYIFTIIFSMHITILSS